MLTWIIGMLHHRPLPGELSLTPQSGLPRNTTPLAVESGLWWSPLGLTLPAPQQAE